MEFTIHPTDNETVLIVAGDAAEQLKAVPHMNDYCTRFRAVVYIMGNHEYYNGSIVRTAAKIKDKVQHDNFHLLDAEEVVIGDTVVLGATLWTDFHNQDSFGMWNAKQAMIHISAAYSLVTHYIYTSITLNLLRCGLPTGKRLTPVRK